MPLSSPHLGLWVLLGGVGCGDAESRCSRLLAPSADGRSGLLNPAIVDIAPRDCHCLDTTGLPDVPELQQMIPPQCRVTAPSCPKPPGWKEVESVHVDDCTMVPQEDWWPSRTGAACRPAASWFWSWGFAEMDELHGATPETVFPLELCDNGVDDDGDGHVDCGDTKCAPKCEEHCFNGVDDNGDGLVDCADPLCDVPGPCAEGCDDHVDNDGDGLVDCLDPDCAGPDCDGATVARVLTGSAFSVSRREHRHSDHQSTQGSLLDHVQTSTTTYSTCQTGTVEVLSSPPSAPVVCSFQIGAARAHTETSDLFTDQRNPFFPFWTTTTWTYAPLVEREAVYVDPSCPLDTDAFLPPRLIASEHNVAFAHPASTANHFDVYMLAVILGHAEYPGLNWASFGSRREIARVHTDVDSSDREYRYFASARTEETWSHLSGPIEGAPWVAPGTRR